MGGLAGNSQQGMNVDPGKRTPFGSPQKGLECFSFRPALLHKSADGRGSPFPGQTYPTGSVTGMPSAV